MLLRNWAYQRTWVEKTGSVQPPKPAENIAPNLGDPQLKFKASPYNKQPQAPKVKKVKEVDVKPMANEPAAQLELPAPTYSPTLSGSAPESMLPPMPPIM